MRERQRRSEERRKLREDLYQLACEIIDIVLLLPMVKANLEFSLQFPWFAEEEQAKVFHDLVEESARRCVHGEPSMNISPEFQCNYLVGIVDTVAHARPALERAIALCRESGKPMPKPLKEWEPNSARPKSGGPRPQLQDAKAIRDHVIALAVSAVVDVQRDSEWPVRLAVGPALSPPSRRQPTVVALRHQNVCITRIRPPRGCAAARQCCSVHGVDADQHGSALVRFDAEESNADGGQHPNAVSRAAARATPSGDQASHILTANSGQTKTRMAPDGALTPLENPYAPAAPAA